MESFIAVSVFLIILLFVFPVIVLIKMITIHHEVRQMMHKFAELGVKLDVIVDKLVVKNEVVGLDVLKHPEVENELAVKIPQVETEVADLVQNEVAQDIPITQITISHMEFESLDPPPIPKQKTIIKELKNEVKPLSPSVFSESKISDVIYATPEIPQKSARQPQPINTVREKNALEKFLAENVLSKIGIVTLVLGIGFFVKYAIDQNWINEIGRVGIGLLTGGVLIGIAHRLRIKYEIFSSILVGGGIAVFYITITIAFREYALFSQPLAFALLSAVTIFSVILSLFYDKKELAVFSLLGGFAAPMMISSGKGSYIILFSYLLILNTGMLVLSFVKKWRIIGIICYVLTVIFLWSWLLSSFNKEYLGATIFAVLFFLQFYLLALFDHFKTGCKITPYQVMLVLTNNLSVFIVCLYIFDDYPSDIRGIITISLAVANAIVMIVLFQKSRIDDNLLYMIIAIVLTFVSLAIPVQLNGHVITMFWAAEMLILLFLWQKSRMLVFHIGFLIISVLVLISYIMDIGNNYFPYTDNHLSIITNRICITGLIVIICYWLCLFLLKKEHQESIIKFTYLNISYRIQFIKKVIIGVIILVSFIVPFLELNHQVKIKVEYDYYTSFRYWILATYTLFFIAVIGFIYHRNDRHKKQVYNLLFLTFLLYATLYAILTTNLRYDIFVENAFSGSYFLLHFISVPVIVFITIYLVKKIKEQQICSYKVAGWIIFFSCVAILSIELDHIIIILLINSYNYQNILYDVHTSGYPILWGILAMILMIWGLKARKVVLRQISLFFFGSLIVKFYAYDVWHMSQAGRIVSFVVLGIILLVVSFLQQKIKVLVKEDKKLNTENENI